MNTIGDYTLLGDFTSNNAGTCRWAFCEKNGREFFIKELLDPKYPVDETRFSPEVYSRKLLICEVFRKEKLFLINNLSKCRNGNICVIMDFFREGPRFYLVTEKVETSSITAQDVYRLNEDQKDTLIRSILYSYSVLHANGVVHSDVKPENIILKETTDGYVTAKIIDFDGSFLVSNPKRIPQGDYVHLAPEAFLNMEGEENMLSEKIDIFALGIVFHLYLSGEMLKVNEEDHYACVSLLNENGITLSSRLRGFYRSLIRDMLEVDPAKRPSARELLTRFEKRDINRTINKSDSSKLKRRGF